MDTFFPTQTLSLFHVFAPYFTAPSFAYFQSYMWALMVVEGRKCPILSTLNGIKAAVGNFEAETLTPTAQK